MDAGVVDEKFNWRPVTEPVDDILSLVAIERLALSVFQQRGLEFAGDNLHFVGGKELADDEKSEYLEMRLLLRGEHVSSVT